MVFFPSVRTSLSREGDSPLRASLGGGGELCPSNPSRGFFNPTNSLGEITREGSKSLFGETEGVETRDIKNGLKRSGKL